MLASGSLMVTACTNTVPMCYLTSAAWWRVRGVGGVRTNVAIPFIEMEAEKLKGMLTAAVMAMQR